MSEQNKDVVRRVIEDHWNGRQEALVGELFDASVSHHTPDGGLSGLEGAAYLLQAYTTAFPDFHLAVHELISERDKIVARYTFTGTHLVPSPVFPLWGNA
jgi:predicted ester cyclase